MEIMDNNINQQISNQCRKGRNLFLGLTFIIAGIVWLLYNFDILTENVFDIIFSWQMMMIIIGVYLMSMRNWVSGIIATALGGFFMLTDMLCIDLPVHKIIIPALLIAAGTGIIITRFCRKN